MSTPIYDSVARDQGWSPDLLSPAFDLADFIVNSKSKVRAHRVLIAARDKEAGKVTPIKGRRKS